MFPVKSSATQEGHRAGHKKRKAGVTRGWDGKAQGVCREKKEAQPSCEVGNHQLATFFDLEGGRERRTGRQIHRIHSTGSKRKLLELRLTFGCNTVIRYITYCGIQVYFVTTFCVTP